MVTVCGDGGLCVGGRRLEGQSDVPCRTPLGVLSKNSTSWRSIERMTCCHDGEGEKCGRMASSDGSIGGVRDKGKLKAIVELTNLRFLYSC